MNYLHYDLHLQTGDTVEVTLDKQANVRLLNCCNYSVDISALDKSREFKSAFKSLFRTADEWKNKKGQQSLPVDTEDGAAEG